jgi:hypothetical protein
VILKESEASLLLSSPVSLFDLQELTIEGGE